MSEVEERLMGWCSSPQECVSAVSEDNVDWGGGGRVHNWRNHVPDALQIMWPELSIQARIVAYLCAAASADAEDWD
jgi:hypothetical protein